MTDAPVKTDGKVSHLGEAKHICSLLLELRSSVLSIV